MKGSTGLTRGIGITLLCINPLVHAGDVYRAESPDGTFRYATQALDPTYSLYIKGDTSPANVASKISRNKFFQPASLDPHIDLYAKKHQVDPSLIRAVIEVESNFNPLAVSPKGASGAMQLMPATAKRYGVKESRDPAQNIEAGVRYLKDLLNLHQGNVALALASYNAGEGTVAKYGKRVPPYKETMLYVPAVLSRMQALQSVSEP